jgi:hypothetical protein
MKLHPLYCAPCEWGESPDAEGRHLDDTTCINYGRPTTVEEYFCRHRQATFEDSRDTRAPDGDLR